MVVGDVVWIGFDLLIADRDAQGVAEALEVLHCQLLHLVGRIASLEAGTQAVALNGLGEDDRGLVLGLHGRLIGGIDLLVVVAAALEAPDLVVGHLRDHLFGLLGATEEVLAHECAGLGLVGLIVAVEGLVHDAHELAVVVLLQQIVPFATPEDLDDVPAGAAEEGLQLLDDLAVATHRAVKALQVAVDHEVQVVQLLVGSQMQQTARFRLIHLTIAEEGPDVLVRGVLDAAVVQVAVELGLVDGVHRAQAHGHGGELPEVRHQSRMRVGAQAVGSFGDFLAEAVEVVLSQPALEVGAGIVAGGGMPLEEDLISTARVVLAAEEVVEAHLVEGCHTRVGGDVAAHGDALLLSAVDHYRGVPAQDAAVAALHLFIPGELRFLVHRDGVDVVSGGDHRYADGLGAGALEQTADDVFGTLSAVGLDELVEGFQPFLCLFGVTVRQLISQHTADVGVLFASAHGGHLSEGSNRAGPGCCRAFRGQDSPLMGW